MGGQQQKGVQHHRHGPAGVRLHDGLIPVSAGGQVGKGGQIPAQLLRLLRATAAEGGGVSDLPPPGESAEKDRVLFSAGESPGVPDRAAGQDHVIRQLGALQLLQTGKAVPGDPGAGPGTAGGIFAAGRLNGLAVRLVGDDLTGYAQSFRCPLQSGGPQQRAGLIRVVEGNKPCFQKETSFPV